ncbi:hypothetical protein HDU83_003318 [Entophlyctis luteolus]|nr:hypothetical protein HDU83_003318 [Entophlyctis luteolus]
MFSVIVVGAGLSGTATAFGLRKCGFEVSLYDSADIESPPDHSRNDNHAGGGLTVHSNGMEALKGLGLYDDIIACPHQVVTQAQILRIDGSDAITSLKIDGRHFLREILQECMLKACISEGVKVPGCMSLVHLDQTESGVSVTFSNGSNATADLLVGADGVHSATRRIAFPDFPSARLVATGNVGVFHRGTLVEGQPLEFPVDMALYLDPSRGRTVFARNCSPKIGSWMSVELVDGPGDKSSAAAVHDVDDRAKTAWQAFPPAELLRESARIAQVARTWSLPRMAVHCVRSAAAISRVALFDVPIIPATRLAEARVVLVGDAAHGSAAALISQNLDAAFESAATLVRVFSSRIADCGMRNSHQREQAPWKKDAVCAAAKIYSKVRARRACAVNKLARLMNLSGTSGAAVGGVLTRAVLGFVRAGMLAPLLAYDYRRETDAAVASDGSVPRNRYDVIPPTRLLGLHTHITSYKGTVVRADVAQAPNGKSRGFGTVLFSTSEEAANAIATYNNYEWHGRKIEVREDRASSASFSSSSFRPHASAPAATADGETPVNVPLPGTAIDVNTVNIRALYVGNLPYSVGWQDLKDLFRNAGNVIRSDIPSDYQGRSKGFGTVIMSSVEEARKAIAMYNGFEWNGRRIEVREDRTYVEGAPPRNAGPRNPQNYQQPILSMDPQQYAAEISAASGIAGIPSQSPTSPLAQSVPVSATATAATPVAGRQLFVGNLPFSLQWQELKDLFRQDGGTVLRADIAVDAQGRSRGYGQVLMASAEEARDAIARLHGSEVSGRVIEVREDKYVAAAAAAAAAGVGAPTLADGGFNGQLGVGPSLGTQVFVGNLPYSSRWQDLKDLFRPLGLNPVHADIMIENETGRSKGCGMVRFATREDAEKALELNGSSVMGRTILVRLDKYAV